MHPHACLHLCIYEPSTRDCLGSTDAFVYVFLLVAHVSACMWKVVVACGADSRGWEAGKLCNSVQHLQALANPVALPVVERWPDAWRCIMLLGSVSSFSMLTRAAYLCRSLLGSLICEERQSTEGTTQLDSFTIEIVCGVCPPECCMGEGSSCCNA